VREVLPLATPLTMSYRCLGRYRYTYRFLQLQLFSSLPPVVPSSFTYIIYILKVFVSLGLPSQVIIILLNFLLIGGYYKKTGSKDFNVKVCPKITIDFFESIKRKEFFFCKQWAENKDSLIIFNILIILKIFKL
jgi:hypothetical protein